MSVKYKLYQEKREKSKYKDQWYARAAMTDVVTLKQIGERIQRNCSMKLSDVLAVLTELVEVMKDELQASHRVIIDGFGSFKVGLKSKPAATVKEFTATKNVIGARVNFLPAVEVDGSSKKRVKTLLSGLTISELPKNAVDADSKEESIEP